MPIKTFGGHTATQLYLEGIYALGIGGRVELTRNGSALVLPEIAVFELSDPMKRVLIDPVRDANPFFHMMEFIWMMAGRNDVGWLSSFNKNIESYANDGKMNAAYGHRWRSEYGIDQIQNAINILTKNPDSRQAVISMWDPYLDNRPNMKDRACNTTIMLRVKHGNLNMLVCNRSNDFFWGALGANIVHMTMLQETIAHFSNLWPGKYTVISMNLHAYTDVKNFSEMMRTLTSTDVYADRSPAPMFEAGQTYAEFAGECELFVKYGAAREYKNQFLNKTALPAYRAYMSRRMGEQSAAIALVNSIEAPDWREACLLWMLRRSGTLSSATLTEP